MAAWGASAVLGADINTATQAELESIAGIGPAVSARLIEERRKAPFASWGDLRLRVKGAGDATAARWSAQGLTVGGAPYMRDGGNVRAPAGASAAGR